MKIEDFDDAIKRKLEGINQKYEQEHIDKVFNYVSHNMRVPFWKNYGSTIMYSSGAAAIVMLLVWSGLQLFENRALNQKIETLQNRLDKIEQNTIAKEQNMAIAAKTSMPNITVKTNTIEITEYQVETETTKSEKTPSQISTNKVSENNNKIIQTAISADTTNLNTNKHSSNTIVYDKNIVPNTVVNTTAIIAQLPVVDSINTGQSEPDSAKAITSQSNKSTDTITSSANNNAGITAKHGIDSSNVQVNTPKTRPNSGVASSISKLFAQVGNAFAETTTETNNHVSIKNLRYRGGLELSMGKQQMGIGLIGEVLFSKRWGLSAGIKFLDINNEKYSNDREFHNKKGMHFENVFRNFMTDTSASNIGIHNMFIQIPIAITYQLPLKKNYSIIASIGTDLDIYSKQLIGYNLMEMPEQQQKFTSNSPVVVFNNAVISVGVQKRWKKMIFQASPFISPQLKTVVYKKEDLYAGIRVNVLFTSKKGNL